MKNEGQDGIISSQEGRGASLPVSLGQMYQPDEDELETILRKIYANKYYTNHGPLAMEFESSLSECLGAKNSVVATNETLALMMALVALDIDGTVIVPSICPPGVVEAVVWSGLTPVFCDINELTGHMTIETVEKAVRDDTGLIIVVSLWGGVCEIRELMEFSQQSGIKLVHYAADGFGVVADGENIGNGNVVTIFSFDSSKILSCNGGGCVVTNDEVLARKIRNIRSSYGAGPFEKVPVTANGRFSELQAGIGLWSLSKLEEHRSYNKVIYESYKQALSDIEGIDILGIKNSITSNYQDFVLTVDAFREEAGRDKIQDALEKLNIYTRGGNAICLNKRNIFNIYHDGAALPALSAFSEKFLQLPVGAHVTPPLAKTICDVFKECKV